MRAGIALLLLAGVGALYEQLASWRDRARFPAPGKRVDIGGRKLHIQCAGEGRPAVIFEAGATGDSTEYSHLLPRVARSTRACSYDRAGFGWSDPSERPASARNLADDLAALLREGDVPPPYVLVASSGGGLTVELFAREHRADVAGIVLLDAITGNVVDAMPEAALRMARRGCVARDLATFGLLRLLDPYHLREATIEERDRAFAFSYRRSTWDSICSLLSEGSVSAAQIRAAPPLRDDLPLIVVRHDRVGDLTKGGVAEDRAVEPAWEREQARTAASSSRGELVVAQGSGHHIRDERPDLVIDAVARIVASTRAK